jgi:hypothetical protein
MCADPRTDNQWLINSVGTYPEPVWQAIRDRMGRPVWRHTDSMGETLPAMFALLRKHAGDVLFQDAFFVERPAPALKGGDVVIRSVRPVCKWTDEAKGVQPGFNVSTRGNGVDAARWPEDLMTQVVM